jgi:hypothetical protein
MDWAQWNPAAAARPWTVGIEEESMFLEPGGWTLVPCIDDVLAACRRASRATPRPRPMPVS